MWDDSGGKLIATSWPGPCYSRVKRTQVKTDVQRQSSLWGGAQYSERKEHCLNTILFSRIKAFQLKNCKKRWHSTVCIRRNQQAQGCGTVAWLLAQTCQQWRRNHTVAWQPLSSCPPSLYHFPTLPTSDGPGDRLSISSGERWGRKLQRRQSERALKTWSMASAHYRPPVCIRAQQCY